uniref:Vacuolar ATPase assembly protein VMA22 n=1 Tax=Callorhinchus milii TaxID=7868 RepID=V9LCT6_CALMI
MGEGEGVCVQLERLLLQYMDQMENLNQKQQQLNSLIEQGWFSLSKSRYAMGIKWVSSLQYGSEMVPTVRVVTRRTAEDAHSFRVERAEDGRGEERARGGEEPAAPEQVRRRKPAHGAEVDVGGSRGEVRERSGEQTDSPVGRGSPRDPLKWFGILVPQSLRLAQRDFKQVVDLAAEIASLQSSVTCTQSQYRALLHLKQQLRGR